MEGKGRNPSAKPFLGVVKDTRNLSVEEGGQRVAQDLHLVMRGNPLLRGALSVGIQ